MNLFEAIIEFVNTTKHLLQFLFTIILIIVYVY